LLPSTDAGLKEILSDLLADRDKSVSLSGQCSLHLDDRAGLRGREVAVQQMPVERVNCG